MIVELLMRARRRSSVLQIVLLTALAALLVPPPTAGYSIISARGLRPALSADTALVTAGVVLNTVLFFVYSLVFDAGRRRDGLYRLDRLWATSPAPAWIVGAGRLSANIGFGTGVIAVSGLLLSSTLYARYGTLPHPVAIVLFLAICLPVVSLAAVTGLFVDLVLPRSPALRTAVVFGLWMAVVLLSVLSIADVLGMADLRRLIDDPLLTRSLSIGFISVSGQNAFVWHDLPANALQGVPARIGDIAATMAGGMLILMVASRRLHAIPVGELGFDWGKQSQASAVGTIVPVSPPPVRRVSGAPMRPASLTLVMGLLVRRLVARSPWSSGVLIAALLLGLSGAAKPGIAIALVAIAPFVLLGRTSPAEVRMAAELERCEAALALPGPALVAGLSILALVLVAALPVLVRVAPLQALTTILGLTATVLWLTWTYRVVNLPSLGVAVAGGGWYLLVFNDVPAAADILGLWQGNGTACAVAGMLALLLVVVLHRARPAS